MERSIVRETAVVSVVSAGGRRALIDGLEALGWRVRVASGDDADLPRLCADLDAKVAFVEWSGGADDSAAGRSGPVSDLIGRIVAATATSVIATGVDPCAEDIVTAMKAGAADFLVLDATSEAADESLPEALARVVEQHARSAPSTATGIIEAHLPGTSRAAVLMRSRLEGLAGLRGPVLVLGEAGSGRDSVARALHAAGPDPAAPFRKIDCEGWQPGEALPATGTLYLDHVDRLRPGAQQYWLHRIFELARRGFERAPRLVASADRKSVV